MGRHVGMCMDTHLPEGVWSRIPYAGSYYGMGVYMRFPHLAMSVTLRGP